MENESEKELEVAEPIEVEEEATDELDETNSSEIEEEFTDTKVNTNNQSSDEEESNIDNSSEQKQVQSKDERAKYAQARRTKEKEDKRIQEAYEKGKLEAFKGKMNPFTNQIIEDSKDVEVYENMYKLSQDGKDPIADYAGYIAQKEREKERESARQKEIEEKASKDLEEFTAKYPNVNLNDLFNDENFSDYMEGKNKSITEIYERYTKLKNSFRTESINQAKQTIANSKATPGSLNNISDSDIDYEKMSREDFLKEVERVKNGQ